MSDNVQISFTVVAKKKRIRMNNNNLKMDVGSGNLTIKNYFLTHGMKKGMA